MMFDEMTKGVKLMTAIAVIVGMLVSGAWFMDAKHADEAEFQEFAANIRCQNASDRYYKVKSRSEKYPNDKELKQELEEARDAKNMQCSKKG